MAEFVARGLDELGHNVVRATSGIDALHLATTEPFDLALVDRMLPENGRHRGPSPAARGKDRNPGAVTDRARADRGPGRRPRRRRRRLSGQAVRIFRTCGADQRPRPPRTDAIRRRPGSNAGPCRWTCCVARCARRRAIALQPREIRLLEELLRNGGRGHPDHAARACLGIIISIPRPTSSKPTSAACAASSMRAAIPT